jgi:GNAT superfamily N-acetyltransferase
LLGSLRCHVDFFGMAERLIECGWDRYCDYKPFCEVDSEPYHGGRCWEIEGGKGFIGYNFCFRNNRLRYRVLPGILKLSRTDQCIWTNENMRCLNRVMVRPEFRGQGLAKWMVRETVGLVGVSYVECLTYGEAICTVLRQSGFHCFGWDKRKEYYYYLWRRETH